MEGGGRAVGEKEGKGGGVPRPMLPLPPYPPDCAIATDEGAEEACQAWCGFEPWGASQ